MKFLMKRASERGCECGLVEKALLGLEDQKNKNFKIQECDFLTRNLNVEKSGICILSKIQLTQTFFCLV